VLTSFRSRLTFANVVAVMALFISLGGFSYAAVQVGSKQIVNNSIRSRDIRNGAVASRDVKNGTIRTDDIANGRVATVDLADNAVDSGKLADNAVGTGKLADGAVGTGKLADGAVSSGKLADGSVGNADLDPGAAVAKGFASVAATNVDGPAQVLSFGGQQTSTAADGVSAVRVGTGIYDVTFLANAGKFSGVDSVDDLTWQVTGRNGFSDGSVFDAASSANEDRITLRIFMRRPSDGTVLDASFSVQFSART